MQSVSPAVSVVIPVHNGEAFLADTLRSVWAQTWRDLECVVVDDGSTDGTPELLRACVDPRLRVIRQSNHGVATARNVGISAARGTCIAFLDADDVWLPDKLRAQLDLLERRPDVGLVYCGYMIVGPDLRPRGRVAPDLRDPTLRRWLMLEGNGIGLSFTAVARRAALDAVGGFDPSLSTSADLDFACRVAAECGVAAVPAPLALYRTHPRQMHLDMRAFEHDMLQIYDRHFPAGSPSYERPRAIANLYTRLFFASVVRRDWPEAARAMSVVLRSSPTRLAALPSAALIRRVRRRLGVLGPQRRSRLSRGEPR